MSTWMILKDESKVEKLKKFCGEEILPINLRLRYSGNEFS